MTTETFGDDVVALFLTKDELAIAIASVAGSIHQVRENLKLVQSKEIRAALGAWMVVAESIRTAFVEARWGLMTAEEVQREHEDLEAARAAGIIV